MRPIPEGHVRAEIDPANALAARAVVYAALAGKSNESDDNLCERAEAVVEDLTPTVPAPA